MTTYSKRDALGFYVKRNEGEETEWPVAQCQTACLICVKTSVQSQQLQGK